MGGWCFLGGCRGGLRLGVGCGGGAGFTDADDDVADVDGVVFVGEDFEDDACHGGGNLGIDLVGGDFEQGLVYGNGVANGLEPLGDGSFGDGFAEFWHDHVGGGAAGSGCYCGFGGRCGFRLCCRCGVCFWLGGWCFLGGCRGGLRLGVGCGGGAGFTDADDDVADVDGVVFVGEDFEDDACHGGGNLGIDLVGGDFEQGLVYGNGVANGLEPLGDGSFGDGFAEFWHDHVGGGAAGSGCCGGFGGRCGFCLCCRGGFRLRLSLLRGRGLASLTNNRNDIAHVNRVVFVSANLEDNACHGGGNLGIHLISGDFEQGLVYGNGIANGLEPLGDGSFGNGLAQLGHHNGVRHCCLDSLRIVVVEISNILRLYLV